MGSHSSVRFVLGGGRSKASGAEAPIPPFALCWVAGEEELSGQRLKCVVPNRLLSYPLGAIVVDDCAGC